MRKIIKLEGSSARPVKRKRVAAYARVSSGKDAMLHSLSAQISYYNSYIGGRGDWKLVGIYADEALTGTKAERPEFQRMLTDCRAGKIDMVITKSITRFARNTVTLLATARELKLLGIDIYFEKENIHTLSSDGELMLTLLASFAQEESRSVSENQKWRIRKMFEAGRPNTGRMLGYRLVDGTLQIVPEEAEIVKMIFADFLSGMGKNAIARKLNGMGVPTLFNSAWRDNTIYGILKNEKYTGNMILQKTYRLDHISKKHMTNHGELPQYYVEDSHEAIIDKETFEKAQQELERRFKVFQSKPDSKVKYPFSGLIRCGICGKQFDRKVTAAGTKYAKPVWMCWTFDNLGKSLCSSQRIPESILITKTSEVLGCTDWDRETLCQHIAEIRVPEHNHLAYVFQDGYTQDVFWQNPSRRESWTEEMKQAARERTLKMRKGDGKMAEQIRKVRKIESRVSLLPMADAVRQKKRVAAYARVSTDSEEQFTSYEAQVDFYTRYIQSNPEWEFVAIYADEGVTGTNTKRREGFNRMVSDALSGKIDLILTKSISRFARNTVDSLTTIRQLKEKGVEVYFEKENIYTLDAKGEVMLTIMSSLAQEESRSISENVTWGKRRSMEEGKFSLAYKRFLGYEKGEDGLPKIVEEEAKIVREIYDRFLEGDTVRTIADNLTSRGIPTPAGKEKWSVSTIMSILQNEKYKGDALLQKTYTVDFLSKTIKKNEGEVPQYYIQNSHPAIIDPDTFELVQNEIKRRRPNRRHLHRCSPFAGKIICGDCGGFYGQKVWHSGSKHCSHIWRCNQKYKNEVRCTTPNLREADIKDAFVIVFNQLLGDKERYIAHFEELLPLLADTSGLEKQLEVLEAQHTGKLGELRHYMEENTRQVQDQVEYNHRFRKMSAECTELEERIKSIKQEILAQKGRKEQIRRCLDELRQCGDILEDFDLDLWNATVESATITADRTFTIRFRDGTEIPTHVAKKK